MAGIPALKYATPSFAKVLRAVSTNRKLAEALPTLDEAMEAGQAKLSGVLDEKEIKDFCGAAALVKHEQAKGTYNNVCVCVCDCSGVDLWRSVMEEENAKGACPFLNARKPKKSTKEAANDVRVTQCAPTGD